MSAPRLIAARFKGTCTRCRGKIAVGDKIVYAPDGGKSFCMAKEECGPQILRATGQADLLGTYVDARMRDILQGK